MVLVRLARQAEIGLGQKIEKESHGKKLLLVRHPKSGIVSVMDAHCFHMGTPLIGGDIEDLDGHACVVCPAHRYRIDIQTGHKIDTDLCGKVCSSADQKQRLYTVHADNEYVWVDLPTNPSPSLPSDYYNQYEPQYKSDSLQHEFSRDYGLLGAAPPTSTPLPPSPLQPYAGHSGYPAGPPPPSPMDTAANDEPQIIFSQQSSQPTSPPPPSLMTFFPSTKKPDPPHVARRKAATAAILNKSYRPPTVDNTPMQSPEKPVIFKPQPSQQPATLVPPPQMLRQQSPSTAGSGTSGPSRQATLFESWSRHAAAASTSSSVTVGGDISMDVN